MARLAVHCRDTGGPQIDLAFIDGDTVERTNVGRQLFSAADIGRNKAQALAAQFAAVFGLPIAAFPQMLDILVEPPDRASALRGAGGRGQYRSRPARHCRYPGWGVAAVARLREPRAQRSGRRRE